MKRIRLIILVSTLFIGIMSCSRDSVNVQEEPINSVGLGKEVKIKATFKDIKGISVSRDVTTRVSNSSWDSGDAIGLFMKRANTDLILPSLANNIKYTTDGNTDIFDTKHKIYFPINKQKVDFIAYYPYIENLNGLNYPIDVSNQSDFYDSEFMYSNNAKGYNSEDEIVKLEFQPQLVKLIVKIYDGSNDTILDLIKNKIEVKISNVHTKANFNLSDTTFNSLSDISDIAFTIIGNKAEAILLPETNFNEIVLVINNNGKTHSLPLSDSVHSNEELIESFLQSHEYDFSIDLIGSNINGGITATIKDRNKVIINRITLPEDPVIDEKPDNGDGANEEEEGPIDEDTTPGDNEDPILTDPDDSEKEKNPENPVIEGDGTQQNPYSIAQILEMENSKNEGVWIKGYIVGCYKMNKFEDFSDKKPTNLDDSQSNLALADSPIAASHIFTLPVKLENPNGYLYRGLNLKDNYDNLQKEILLMGDIGKWNLGKAGNTPRTSVIKLKEAYLDGVKIT